MTNNINVQFLCKDCERYGSCQYYHNRKEDSYICKNFHLPQQGAGQWINAKVGKLFPSNDFKCSKCGNILDFNGLNCGRGDANYCPNCGAKMGV